MDTAPIEDRETFIKRLKYLAGRRSTLELDLMLTRISSKLNWADLSDSELVEAARILEMDDLDLQKALLARSPVPKGFSKDLWEKFLNLL